MLRKWQGSMRSIPAQNDPDGAAVDIHIQPERPAAHIPYIINCPLIKTREIGSETCQKPVKLGCTLVYT